MGWCGSGVVDETVRGLILGQYRSPRKENRETDCSSRNCVGCVKSIHGRLLKLRKAITVINIVTFVVQMTILWWCVLKGRLSHLRAQEVKASAVSPQVDEGFPGAKKAQLVSIATRRRTVHLNT